MLEAAQSAALPSDREILHAIPQEFIVDEQGGIVDPLGMLGTRLEVTVHLVTGHVTRNKTLLTCVNRAGIEVRRDGVRAARDRRGGADRRTSASSARCWSTSAPAPPATPLLADGEVQHSAVLPIGAGHFTNDLAMVLRTPFAEAERIKMQARLLPGVDGRAEEEGVAVPSGGRRRRARGAEARALPRSCSRAPRSCSTSSARTSPRTLGRGGLRGGVVLTGGGAQLDGLLELAEQVFDASVALRPAAAGSAAWST